VGIGHWLESDKQHTKHFKKLLKQGVFKKGIELIAYASNDALAVNKDFHQKHSAIIDAAMRHLRIY
jgi:hypothetical protein